MDVCMVVKLPAIILLVTGMGGIVTKTNGDRFKRFEHSGWQAIPKQYNESFGDLTIQSIPALLDAAGVKKGIRLLDVCTGPGFAAAAAAVRGADVTGLEVRPRMPMMGVPLSDDEINMIIIWIREGAPNN